VGFPFSEKSFGVNRQEKKNQECFKGKRLGIITLGCARNTVDSEKILQEAKEKGALICSPEKASVILVNTCAFTQEAKEESLGVISELASLKKKGKIEGIFVHGCLVERYAEELKKNFNEVDNFCGITDFKKTFDRPLPLTPAHIAYVKISEGCANRCSYCAIPNIKGPLRSRSESSILREIELLEKSGVREIDIVGQDLTLFGRERFLKKNRTLPLVRLLKKILSKTRIPWVRLLYLHPQRLSDDLLELIGSKQKFCSYVDLPLQHINDRILKLMNRGTTKKQLSVLIKKIRHRFPAVALRTSFIVGFPSETIKEFRELLDFVKETRFQRLGAFIYSREEGTRAYGFGGQQAQKIKQERYHALMSLQKDISKENQKKYVGQMLDVMVDGAGYRQDIFLGRSRFDAPEVDGTVFLKSKIRLKPGAIVLSRITGSDAYDLKGEAVS